ncbi:PAS domain-containing sensor histidine kinase [Ideonella benzenivorans]|uniref:PAS domain-containing sensor histidine kinase n=1 Tax=Ideonella benzenivorans TaxID=2831643 RepID=UPI001CECA1A3|nr:PAS domain S-box protein [Ideonella benzenivorans]
MGAGTWADPGLTLAGLLAPVLLASSLLAWHWRPRWSAVLALAGIALALVLGLKGAMGAVAGAVPSGRGMPGGALGWASWLGLTGATAVALSLRGRPALIGAVAGGFLAALLALALLARAFWAEVEAGLSPSALLVGGALTLACIEAVHARVRARMRTHPDEALSWLVVQWAGAGALGMGLAGLAGALAAHQGLSLAGLLVGAVLLAFAGLGGLACGLWRGVQLWRVQATQDRQGWAALPLPAMLVDARDRILRINRAAEAQLGLVSAEAQGTPLARWLPELDQAAEEDGVRRLEAVTASGARIPVACHTTPLTGTMAARVLQWRDLRPELARASALAHSQSLVRTVAWSMAIGSLGEEPRIETVNAAYARMLGYTPEELLGVPVRQCIAVRYWPDLAAARERTCASGSAQVELRHVHRDGHELPTLASLSLVRDALDRPRHVLVSVQDISALKTAEQQATQLATRLNAVLAAMPVGVWIGDADGRTAQVNPAVQALGLDGDTVRSLGRGDHESLMRRAVITGGPVLSGIRRMTGSEGQPRELRVTAQPIRDGEGRVVGALAIDEDLTEIHRHMQAQGHAAELLERIFNACTVGMALADPDGRILRCNVAWQLLVDAAPGQSLLDTLDEADRPPQRELLGLVVQGEHSVRQGEYKLRRPGGAAGWMALTFSRLPGGPGQAGQVLVQAADAEPRRRAAEEIAAGHLRLAAAQKMAGMGEWQLNVDTDEVTCSSELLRLVGYGLEDRVLPRGRWPQRLHPEDRAAFATAVDQVLRSGDRLSVDVRLRRPEGREMVVHIHGVMQRHGPHRLLTGTLQDVTERKRIEDALRDSQEQLRALVTYEDHLIEDERKRIAREVHDELGQLLTALRMDLSMLRQGLPAGSDQLQRAERMRETMATMADVVRHVASHLRPGALDMGLVAAIEWLAEDFSLRWETHCELDLPHDLEPRLPEAAALALFRAVQESLTNIAKHARATEVTIRLQQHGTTLHLSVSDNGQGFDPQAVAARRGGLGLLGMRERMLAIGAEFHITTRPGGTVVDILYDMAKTPTPQP